MSNVSTEHLKIGFNTFFRSFCGKLYFCRNIYCELQDRYSPLDEGFKLIVSHYNNSLYQWKFCWITDYKIYLFSILKVSKVIKYLFKTILPN